jgi:mannose-1-phosphate guanylyltransferase
VPGELALKGNVFISPSARVANDAQIVGPSVVGDNVEVASGARIERSIIWQGSRIGANAVVRDSIVGMSYTVEPGTTVSSTIVANDPDAVKT